MGNPDFSTEPSYASLATGLAYLVAVGWSARALARRSGEALLLWVLLVVAVGLPGPWDLRGRRAVWSAGSGPWSTSGACPRRARRSVAFCRLYQILFSLWG